MRYRELLRASDADAVHDLVIRHGPEDPRARPPISRGRRTQPVAKRRAARGGAGRYEIPSPNVPEPATAEGSIWDPVARVIADEGLRELAGALGELDPRDVLVLWGRAASRSDEEIAAEWDRLGFTPSSPSAAAIRKRRERAGVQVRERLARSQPIDT